MEHGRRHVASRALEHGAEGVDGAAQAAGDRIGEVDGDQDVVDVVHGGEEVLAPVELTGAEAVEQVAAQLAGRLGQAPQPRRRQHVELVGAGEGGADDERRGQAGLDVLLLGVVQEPGMGDRRERGEGDLGFAQRLLGVGGEGRGPVGIQLMDGADAAAGGPDDPPAGGQADLAGGVRLGQPRPRRVDEGEEVVVAGVAQSSARRVQDRGRLGGQPFAERRRASAGSGAR